MSNSVDPGHLASEEANWSGSTLFAKTGHIWVKQDKGEFEKCSHSKVWSVLHGHTLDNQGFKLF